MLQDRACSADVLKETGPHAFGTQPQPVLKTSTGEASLRFCARMEGVDYGRGCAWQIAMWAGMGFSYVYLFPLHVNDVILRMDAVDEGN